MPALLLTNDDGIEAEGLRRLEECLAELGEITVVAPDRERSAVSHGLTIDVALEVLQLGAGRYSLNGTPADCVIYALRHLCINRPDLVISGINHGANLGDDIMYSGTVAGAREAARHGIPAIAFSQAYDDKPIRFDSGLKYVTLLVKSILDGKLNGGLCLNVNLPVRKPRGVKVTRQGCSSHAPHLNFLDRQDPDDPSDQPAAAPQQPDLIRDHDAVLDHYISVTPLQRDQTDYSAVSAITRDLPEAAASSFHLPLFR